MTEGSVFITIFRAERDWINSTKGDLTRAQRLHVIIENYKRAGLDAQYGTGANP